MVQSKFPYGITCFHVLALQKYRDRDWDFCCGCGSEHSGAAPSDPSVQSICLLHFLLPSIHTPLAHLNDVGGHLIKIVLVILNKI